MQCRDPVFGLWTVLSTSYGGSKSDERKQRKSASTRDFVLKSLVGVSVERTHVGDLCTAVVVVCGDAKCSGRHWSGELDRSNDVRSGAHGERMFK